MLGSNKVSAVVDEDEAADDFERDSSIICEVTGFPFPEELLMHNELKCGKKSILHEQRARKLKKVQAKKNREIK